MCVCLCVYGVCVVCVCLCVCGVCVCDRLKKHKTIWLIHKSFPSPIFFVFSFCLSCSYFPLFWVISCLYLPFSSAKQHTAPYIVYSMLHFTFYAPAHIPHCISKYVLHFTLHSASHYKLHCTLHSTSNTPRCVPHSTFHLV